MTLKNFIWAFHLFLLIACGNNNKGTSTESIDTTPQTIKLNDSSRADVLKALESMIESGSKPGDTTISAKYITQGKSANGQYYITIRAHDSIITLINFLPLKEADIAKLKKEGNNITVTYNDSDKTVKLLIANYEEKK